MANAKKRRKATNEPTIENRRARHDYAIEDTLECGIELRGTEIKSIRAGQVSLGEGYVKASAEPLALELHGVHIGEYPERLEGAPARADARPPPARVEERDPETRGEAAARRARRSCR